MRRPKHQPNPSPAWTHRDDALLYTCHLARLVHQAGDLSGLAQVIAPFPAELGPDDRLWASGPFVLREYRALGDGSWQTSGFIAGGTGAFGAGLLAASLVTNAATKNAARARAAADATPRWHPIDHGTLYVGRYGIVLHTPAVLPWTWTEITSATMVWPGGVHFTGTSSRGPISWVLESDWSELVFILWALTRRPTHPQLLGGGWLPPGWTDHAGAHPQTVPPGLPGLTPGP